MIHQFRNIILSVIICSGIIKPQDSIKVADTLLPGNIIRNLTDTTEIKDTAKTVDTLIQGDTSKTDSSIGSTLITGKDSISSEKSKRIIPEKTLEIIKDIDFSILLDVLLLLLTAYLLSKLIDRILLLKKNNIKFTKPRAIAGIFKTIIWLIVVYFIISIFINITYNIIPIILAAVIVFTGVAMIPFAFNLAGGLFISFTMPFVENDFIVLKDYKGIVKNITLKATYLFNEEQGIILIPNSYFLKNPVANASKSKAEHTLVLNFEFPADFDTKNLITIINNAALSNPYTSSNSAIKVFLKEIDLIDKIQRIELYVNICDSRFENDMKNLLNMNILQIIKKEKKI
jgi:small-conductance mechanosensitive channel